MVRINPISLHFSFSENLNLSRFSEESIHHMTEDIHQLQLQRLQHLQHACNDREVFKNVAYKGKSHMTYYYSSGYNFSFCKVPKTGCSFWTQIFAILRKGSNASKEIFGFKREPAIS